MKRNLKQVLFIACILVLGMATQVLALTVTQTNNPGNLQSALGGTGLTINSVSITNGAFGQFGTYTGFTSPPVTIGNGIVMSTGYATQTIAAFHNSNDTPSTNMNTPGTTEFDNYGPGRIANFSSSHDVAALQVNFTLAHPSWVSFQWIFGSIEYPKWISEYTDTFLVFLDGTANGNQIVYDANGFPPQVGVTFGHVDLIIYDTNTAFSDPHGLLSYWTVPLTTSIFVSTAGNHTIFFEVGDVNDHFIDSAVFISNFRADNPVVPIPPGILLLLQ